MNKLLLSNFFHTIFIAILFDKLNKEAVVLTTPENLAIINFISIFVTIGYIKLYNKLFKNKLHRFFDKASVFDTLVIITLCSVTLFNGLSIDLYFFISLFIYFILLRNINCIFGVVKSTIYNSLRENAHHNYYGDNLYIGYVFGTMIDNMFIIDLNLCIILFMFIDIIDTILYVDKYNKVKSIITPKC